MGDNLKLESEIMIKCPECKATVKEKDFRLEIFDREIEVSLTCPDCGKETILGFSQEDLDD